MNGAFNRGCGRQMRVSALATGLLLLWAGIHLLAAVPDFHHGLHEDETSPDHQCFLTEFSSGSIEPAPVHESPKPLRELLCSRLSSVADAPAFDLFSLPLAPRPPPLLFQSYSRTGS